VVSVAPDALRALENFDWPGNIRELRNLIERAVALCPGHEIRLDDLPGPSSRVADDEADRRPQPSSFAHPTVARTTLAQIKREAELSRITEASKSTA